MALKQLLIRNTVSQSIELYTEDQKCLPMSLSLAKMIMTFSLFTDVKFWRHYRELSSKLSYAMVTFTTTKEF